MLISPMPKMAYQFYLGFVVDLNCGWYCAVAMLEYWYYVHSGKFPDKIPLPCKLGIGYHCHYDLNETYAGASKKMSKPGSLKEWETQLNNNGPTIVSGQVGRMDFESYSESFHSYLKKKGLGHFVLVVGANAKDDIIYYKDPLVGNEKLMYKFKNFDSKIDDDVYYTDKESAIKIFNQLGI